MDSIASTALAAIEQLPHDIDAEVGAIASWLHSPDETLAIIERTTPQDFLDEKCKAVRTAMVNCRRRGEDVFPPSLVPELKRHVLFAELASVELLQMVGATSAHCASYVDRILEKSLARKIIHTGEAAIKAAANCKGPFTALNDLKASIADLEREARAGKPRHKFSLADLCRENPTLNPPVIEGLLREREVANIISVSKIGKSWLGYGLALSVLAGLKWLGTFATSAGRVLLIDNELHKSTLAHRIPAVANAMGFSPEWYIDDLEIWSLRGNLRSLNELADELRELAGEFKLIIFDAKYRFAVAGVSENENAAETAIYNLIDQIADETGAAIVLIHHSSKGNQSEKRVTDVGSGAGAQSRAADCHLILREHEEENITVLEAAVRSFAPVAPLALRWNFPIWLPAENIDPTRLKGRNGSDERQQEKDKQGVDATIAALLKGRATARQLRQITGFGQYRQDRLLDLIVSQGHAVVVEEKAGGKTHVAYQLSE